MSRPGWTPRALWVLVRWVTRDVWRPLLVQLLPRWFLFALLLVEADVIVDTRLLRQELTAAPPWAAGLFVGLGALLLGLGERTLVSDLLLGPRHAVLRRQPLPEWAWGPASLPVLLPVALPLGVLALFWYGPLAWPSALGWTLLVALPAVCLATDRAWGLPLALGASALAGAAAAMGHALVQRGSPDLLGLFAGGLLLPLVGKVVARSGHRPAASPMGLGLLRPRGPVTALLHRDGLALWRNERALVWAALGMAPVVGLVTFAAYANGGYPGPVLVRFPLVCLCVAGPLALAAVAAAARQTGPSFDPRHWPVRVEQRALALALLASATMVPSWAAAAVAGPPIGLEHLRIGVFVALVGLGAAWWVASRPGMPNTGSWLYWLGACLGAALWRPGPLLGVLMGLGAWWGALGALRRQRRQR